ncbi:MAG: PKD domain-containing protein, partial [Bacteroidetes bacterium]|nr:PKD domain-containing protein [Bacteroidota bacterium]
ITYLWNFGDNKTSSQKMPSHIYSGVGVYDVSLEIKFLKSQKTKKFDYPKTITVKETPIAQFSYDINEEDGTCLFTDNSSEAIQWNWVFGDKNMSKDKNPEHVYIADGIYNVQLNVSNASGCSDTSYKKISVKLKEQYSTPNSFSPNGDGLNDFFGPVINENMTSDGFEMNIYNKSGVLVFVTKDINIMWDGRIKGTSSYSEPGVYIWKISMKNKFGINYEKTGFVTLLNF